MDWPMRFVRGLVRRNNEVREYEVPGYAWILNVRSWFNHVRNLLGENHPLIKAVQSHDNGNSYFVSLDEDLVIYRLTFWIHHRSEDSLLRADNNWDAWEQYLSNHNILGESDMDKPAVLVDVPTNMLFIAQDSRVIGMCLEAGLPPNWGWRAVDYDTLIQRANSPVEPEFITHGSDHRATMAAFKSTQRRSGVLTRVRDDDGDFEDRVLMLIRKKGGAEK